MEYCFLDKSLIKVKLNEVTADQICATKEVYDIVEKLKNKKINKWYEKIGILN